MPGIFSSIAQRIAGFFTREASKPSQRQGVGGTQAVGGFLVSSERSAELSFGPERMKTLSTMVLNNTTVGASMRFILTLIGGIDWEVSPAKDSGAEGEEKAKLVEKILHDMSIPWFRVVRGAALFKFFGFSVQERIAKVREDGVIGLETIERRPQFTIEQWDFDEDGCVVGFGQRVPVSGELLYLPREKCVYNHDDSISDSPGGVGLLRHCVEKDRQLQAFERIEGWLFELDARGMPVGRAPLALLQQLVDDGIITEQERTARINAIKKIVQSHVKNPGLGLMLDSSVYRDKSPAETPSGTQMYGMELLQGGAGDSTSMDAAIKRKTFEIARIFGTQGLFLGGDGKGSLALSEEQLDMCIEIIKSILKELAWCFRQDVVLELFDLNGWDRELAPELKPNAAQLRNIREFVDSIVKIVNAGAYVPQDDKVWEQIRGMIGAVEGEEPPPEVLGVLQRVPGNMPPGAVPPPGAPGGPGGPPLPGQPAAPGTPPEGDEVDVPVDDLEDDEDPDEVEQPKKEDPKAVDEDEDEKKPKKLDARRGKVRSRRTG